MILSPLKDDGYSIDINLTLLFDVIKSMIYSHS